MRPRCRPSTCSAMQAGGNRAQGHRRHARRRWLVKKDRAQSPISNGPGRTRHRHQRHRRVIAALSCSTCDTTTHARDQQASAVVSASRTCCGLSACHGGKKSASMRSSTSAGSISICARMMPARLRRRCDAGARARRLSASSAHRNSITRRRHGACYGPRSSFD